MESKQVTLSVETVERLVAIADRAGVRQGIDIVGPFDTVVVEGARRMLEPGTLTDAIAEITRLRDALRRIETGECVTDWADQPHEQMQDEARTALSHKETNR